MSDVVLLEGGERLAELVVEGVSKSKVRGVG